MCTDCTGSYLGVQTTVFVQGKAAIATLKVGLIMSRVASVRSVEAHQRKDF